MKAAGITLGLSAVALLAVWVVAPGEPAASPAASASIPMKTMGLEQIEPQGFSHQQVLFIEQDGLHPSDEIEVVLDAWVAKSKPDEIAEVRLWWLDESRNKKRVPFGKNVLRTIDIDYATKSQSAWTVSIAAGRRVWSFDVELGNDGRLAAYGDIKTKNGDVSHCRADTSRMVPKRALGLVVGLDRLEIDCVDAAGERHTGAIKPRKRKR